MVLWVDVTSEALTPPRTQHMEGLHSDHIVLDIVLNSGHILHNAPVTPEAFLCRDFHKCYFDTLWGGGVDEL